MNKNIINMLTKSNDINLIYFFTRYKNTAILKLKVLTVLRTITYSIQKVTYFIFYVEKKPRRRI